MKATILIMALAVILLACVALYELRLIKKIRKEWNLTRTVNADLLLKLRKATSDYDSLKAKWPKMELITVQSPEKETPQYVAMKMSGLLGPHFHKIGEDKYGLVVSESPRPNVEHPFANKKNA